MPTPTPVIVSDQQRKQLEETAEDPASRQRAGFRARIILGLAHRHSAQAVADELKTSLASISKWRGRWSQMGFAGLEDAPGKSSLTPPGVMATRNGSPSSQDRARGARRAWCAPHLRQLRHS